MDQASETCKNCGTTFQGNYCNSCGEKVYHSHHKNVGHLFEEVFHFLTHFEGSFFTTIRMVFTRPGQLSLDYCNGLRKRYFKPLSLYLLCIVIYLLFSPFQGLNMKFYSFLNPQYGFTWFTKPLAEKKIRSSSTTYEKISEKYNEESPHISKILLLVLLPLMAFVMYLLFYKRSHFYFDHFIMATEWGSVWITIKFILLPAIMLLLLQIDRSFMSVFDDSNWILWQSVSLLMLIFAVLAFKRFYRQKWSWTILKAIVFFFIFEIFIMRIYHALLFLIVMLFI